MLWSAPATHGRGHENPGDWTCLGGGRSVSGFGLSDEPQRPVRRRTGRCGLRSQLRRQELRAGWMRSRLRRLRRGSELQRGGPVLQLHSPVHGPAVRKRRLRRFLRQLPERPDLQLVGPMHLLHSRLHRQGLWQQRMRWLLRDLSHGPDLQLGGPLRRLHSELQRQDLRRRWLWRDLRGMPVGRAVHEWSVHRVLHDVLLPELLRQGLRRRRLRWHLRNLPVGLHLPDRERPVRGVFPELQREAVWQRRLQRLLRHLPHWADLQFAGPVHRLYARVHRKDLRSGRLRRDVRLLRHGPDL